MFKFSHANGNTNSLASAVNGPRHSAPLGDVPKNVGRTILVGGAVVATSLVGFYYSMLVLKRREQAAGRNPYHEQITANLSRKVSPLEHQDPSNLQPLSHHHFSSTPPAFPGSDHHSGHQTIASFNKAHGRGTAGTQSISGAQLDAQGRQVLSNAGGTMENFTLGNENVALDRGAGDEPVGTSRFASSSSSIQGEGGKKLDKRGVAALRNMVPPPQRGRNDGSGKAYTKSPDYAKNYHKTDAGKNRVLSTLGQSARMEEASDAALGVAPLSPKLV